MIGGSAPNSMNVSGCSAIVGIILLALAVCSLIAVLCALGTWSARILSHGSCRICSVVWFVISDWARIPNEHSRLSAGILAAGGNGGDFIFIFNNNKFIDITELEIKAFSTLDVKKIRKFVKKYRCHYGGILLDDFFLMRFACLMIVGAYPYRVDYHVLIWAFIWLSSHKCSVPKG